MIADRLLWQDMAMISSFTVDPSDVTLVVGASVSVLFLHPGSGSN